MTPTKGIEGSNPSRTIVRVINVPKLLFASFPEVLVVLAVTAAILLISQGMTAI